MEIDKWVGPYKVRAFPWIDGKLIYFNVQYYSPGQSLEKPPVMDRTVYITDDEAGRRLVFEFTHTLTDYVAQLPMHMKLNQSKNTDESLENKIIITVESAPPSMLAGYEMPNEQAPQRNKSKRHSEPER